jgi:hypothetical protein
VKKSVLVLGLIATVLWWTSTRVLATPLDVSAAGASGDINGSKMFHVTLDEASGSGRFEPFVRIHGNGSGDTQHGYNTDGTVQFDTLSGVHTHSLLLSLVPTVKFSGVKYLEFALDMGEPGNDSSESHFLDLIEAQFFIASTGNLTPNTFTSGVLDGLGTPVYRLDSPPTDNEIILGDLSNGNGRIDYLWYIPAAPFGSDGTKFVYMYSSYGRSEGSFEEWGTCVDPENRSVPLSCAGRAGVPIDPPQVPEPSAFILLAAGMLILTGASQWPGPRH